jgi:hypothetical protein
MTATATCSQLKTCRGGVWVNSYVVRASSGAQVALRIGMRSHVDVCRLCRSIGLVLFSLALLDDRDVVCE